jgi:HPt (histidine-containing phosphotransfer) domain-containing protein
MDDGPAIAVLDVSQLRNITLNDESLMREVIHSLLGDAFAKIGEIESAIAAGRASHCVQLSHSASGACANVGALSMARLFAAVERHAAKDEVERCRPLIGRLRRELEKLRAAATAI